MSIHRKIGYRFKGALDVIIYNLPVYLFSILILSLGSAVLIFLPLNASIRTLLIPLLIMNAFWSVSSILVSHWIYDGSPLYRWTWLRSVLFQPPDKWVTIHAGLDEACTGLCKIFQKSQGISVDIFDPEVMTQSSILRARQRPNASTTALRASMRGLPFSDNSLDAVFCAFSLHEIRTPEARSRLFNEMRRILKPSGFLMILEHGRDLANFLAFGPGFFHFLSAGVWLKHAREAGLCLAKEISLTPFVKARFFNPQEEVIHDTQSVA